MQDNRLFSAGGSLKFIYFLALWLSEIFYYIYNGEEHITKFFYPGDLLGVDGFDNNIYRENVPCFLEN